jgi:dTDP-glucose pyrophosphorylase
MTSGDRVTLPITFNANSATIRDAMVAISRGIASAAFAITPDGALVGIVTDGDIRRALIGGADVLDLVSPFIQRGPALVSETESRSAVLDLMQARAISQVPIVNSAGQLVGVHLLQELLGRIKRPNLALILAGGRGTRLQPTTDSLPKPMISVAGTPILERVLNHLVGFGVTRIVLSIGYLGEMIGDHFGDGSRLGCEITYLREDPNSPRGTGGPLASLPSLFQELNEPILVMNGDLITQFDVAAMLNHHRQSESMATIGALNYSHEVPYGVLNTNGAGEITAIVEKPVRQELVSGGVYVLDARIPHHVPVDAFFPMTQVLSDCIDRNEKVTAWPLDEGWVDVGRPQDLARAQGLE